jgi:hypothetical protein
MRLLLIIIVEHDEIRYRPQLVGNRGTYVGAAGGGGGATHAGGGGVSGGVGGVGDAGDAGRLLKAGRAGHDTIDGGVEA